MNAETIDKIGVETVIKDIETGTKYIVERIEKSTPLLFHLRNLKTRQKCIVAYGSLEKFEIDVLYGIIRRINE